MKEEVDSATGFLAGLIANKVSKSFLDAFKYQIKCNMYNRYENHWHPQKPHRGSAYRSIAVNYNRVDVLIQNALEKASQQTNIPNPREFALKIGKHFPQELTLWVDPMDVSYRIGDNGSIGVVYSGSAESACDSDSEGSSSSSSSSGIGSWASGSVSNSPSSSPCSSPVGSPPRPSPVPFCAARSIPQQCRQQTFMPPYYHKGLQMVYS